MPIKSYILIPNPDELHSLTAEISKLSACSVHPAENKEVLVVVTETDNDEQDKVLLGTMQACKHLQHISLVSGFD